MDNKTRSSSRTTPTSSRATTTLSAPDAQVMNLNSPQAQAIISHWEWRTFRFTLFRLALTIGLFLLSIPWPMLPLSAESEEACDTKLVAYIYCLILASALLLLISITFTWEWLTDSNAGGLRKDWTKVIRADTDGYLPVGLALVLTHFGLRYIVPRWNARAISDRACSCQDEAMRDQLRKILNGVAVYILSIAFVWTLPIRMALLRPATRRNSSTLSILAFLGYLLCFAAVHVATQKLWSVYCSQAAVGGKCTGEALVRLVELAGKVRGTNLGLLGPIFGWSMSALNAPVKAIKALT